MRCGDTGPRLTDQRSSDFAHQPGREDGERREPSYHLSQCGQKERAHCESGPLSGAGHTISTERIMQAVEVQKQITQQLDDLRVQQKQRALLLRRIGVIVAGAMFFFCGILAIVLVVLSMSQPEILLKVLTLASTPFASLIALEEGVQAELSLNPVNNWVLSGVALAIVLMMGLWLRLMRFPQEA